MSECVRFFFSSRRRHTRWTGDWSSDVCSSDLRTDEGGEGLARWGDQVLLEGNTLVARQHGIARAALSVPVAHERGHVGDLVAARLTLTQSATQTPEGFEKERFDVVGLQAPRLGAFHLLADSCHAA